jgi:hypothetical protein
MNSHNRWPTIPPASSGRSYYARVASPEARRAPAPLNPREQVRARAERVKSAVQSVDPKPYAGVAAVAAVGIGTVMALKGLRGRANHDYIEPTADDFIGE